MSATYILIVYIILFRSTNSNNKFIAFKKKHIQTWNIQYKWLSPKACGGDNRSYLSYTLT